MEFLDGGFLTRHLLERYSKNPRGWSYTLAPARKYGFFDTIVSSANEAWQIKIDSVYKPFPLMLGASTELDSSKMNSFSPIPFGYRNLEPAVALELLKGADGPERASPDSTFTAKLGHLLASLEPVVPEHGRSYAEGPFMLSTERPFKFTENQESLDNRLAAELHKVMRNKYPNYG